MSNASISRNTGRVMGWPRLLVFYGLGFPVASVAFTAVFWPKWQSQPMLALGSELLSLALLAAGILLLDEPGQRVPAWMLIAASVVLTAGWLSDWPVGPLPLISVPASPIGIVLAGWAMFRYPDSRPRALTARNFFVFTLAFLAIGISASIVSGTPRWAGMPASSWWPSLFPDQALYNFESALIGVGGATFSIAYVVLWARLWRRLRGIARRLTLPVAVAASVTALVTVVELALIPVRLSAHSTDLLYAVDAFIYVTVPVSFVISVLRRRFARARLADLLLGLRPPTPESLQGALRTALEDPFLEVREFGPAADGGSGRLTLPVYSRLGEPLAVVLTDPALSVSDDLVRAAITASSLALENSRLEAMLRFQLQDMRVSRRRIVEAQAAERRRLERDLHDGVQAQLQGLKAVLALAEGRVADAAARELIGRARDELVRLLRSVSDLAHGLHPSFLSQVGLYEAVRSMAERYTVPIDVDLPRERLDETSELTAYYVIAESITNAVKHAQASLILITGERSAGYLCLEVTDNGRGGARVCEGTGLLGLIDRVSAIGGAVTVRSPEGSGTTITAEIPCAWQ